MATEIIVLPQSLSLTNIIRFSNEMFQCPRADVYEFDFGNMRWFPPFSMVYLAAQINRFRQERAGAEWVASNYQTHTYAAHMGFFQSFELPHGNLAGEALGSSTYIPLTEICRAELVGEGVPAGEIIDQHSQRLAAMLTREEESEVFKTLQYSIREILRNSIEHSGADKVIMCAQYWPSREMVEVGIVDCGVGVRNGLSNNPHLDITSDDEALRLSMMPGISGVAYEGAARNHYDAWANSGYGLFMTSSICIEGGSFFMASGNAVLLCSGAEMRSLEQNFHGTAIRLSFSTNRVQGLDSLLRQLAAKGQRISEELGGVHAHGASISSRLPPTDL